MFDDAPDEPFTVCPYCQERVDPDDPESVYAVEQIDSVTMGPTREILDGMGGYFHPECPPELSGTRADRVRGVRTSCAPVALRFRRSTAGFKR